MEDSDIIKYLASTIAHKEKVILDLTRKLDEAKADYDRVAEYWRDAEDQLRKFQHKCEGKTKCCKGSADDILNGNA